MWTQWWPIAFTPTTAFVIAVLVAVFAQVLSQRLKLPAIALWLAVGMALGPFGLNLIQIGTIEPALLTLIELGLAIILFEGGLNLNLRALREHSWVVSRLLVFGPLLTMAIGGWTVHALAGLDWPLALLFGTLIAVGGPTVILPIVRQIRVDRDLRHILTGEAMLVDAVGAILAIVMLQVAISDQPNINIILKDLLVKFAVGTVVGTSGGWLLSRALSSSWLKDADLRSITTLASAWGLFMLADSISSQAGLLAVLVAGATVQRQDLPDIQRLRHFKASLSILLISVLFVLLAANLDLSVLVHNLGTGLVAFAAVTLVARPLTALLSGLGTQLSPAQIGFLAGMAPRGVVAAAITSLFGLILEERSIAGSEVLQSLVYIIIIVSVLLYGFLAGPLSRWLKVQGVNERSVLIIGGGQFGSEMGRVLGEDREVRFIDLNSEVISNARRAGYMAVCGNALDPLYMEVVHAEEVGAVLIMTGSSDHNLLIARLAYEQFHVQEIYVALGEGDEVKHARLLHQLQARRLFAKPYSFTYWNDQAYRKRLIYEEREIKEDSGLIGQRLADVRIPHGVQPLAIIRDGQTLIPHDDLRFEAGDNIRLLLRPERIQTGQPLILPPASDNSIVTSQPSA